MKIISALGGSGSSFIFKTLKKSIYKPSYLRLDFYKIEKKIPKYIPFLLKSLRYSIKLVKAYPKRYIVLKRPDAFWTDWFYHKKGYDPNSENLAQDLKNHKSYIIKLYKARSGGIMILPSEIRDETLPSLAKSYIEKMECMEKILKVPIILLSAHWGELGILKELGVKTIYIIRDPYNSLISHSKDLRHQKDYLRRGFKNINTKEWIDAYLNGPQQYWINHAESALNHENAIIIRYNKFSEDWQKVTGLPDISKEFSFKENNVTEILTKESINYIYEQTKHICNELGFKKLDIS